MGVSKSQFYIFGECGFADIHRDFAEAVQCLFNPGGEVRQARYFPGAHNGAFDFIEKINKNSAFFHSQLAPQQIHGLNAVGPFIDTGDFTIAVKLFDRIFFGKAIATMHLNGLLADKLPALAAVSFNHRRQQLNQITVALFFIPGFCSGFFIKTIGGVINKAAHAVHIRFH